MDYSWFCNLKNRDVRWPRFFNSKKKAQKKSPGATARIRNLFFHKKMSKPTTRIWLSSQFEFYHMIPKKIVNMITIVSKHRLSGSRCSWYSRMTELWPWTATSNTQPAKLPTNDASGTITICFALKSTTYLYTAIAMALIEQDCNFLNRVLYVEYS